MNQTSNSSNLVDVNTNYPNIDIQIIFICLSIVGLFIVAANGLVFVLVYKKRTLLRKTNFFLISLAVSDISSGLIGIPLIILCNTYTAYESLRKSMDICNKFLAISTILHLLSATIERYIKVLAPLHYRRLVTKKRILMVLAGIWMVSLVTPVIELSWYDDMEATQKYSLALLCCFVIFPLTVMSLVTFHIFYLIRQQKSRLKILANRTIAKKQKKRKQAERRAVMVYSAMSISFAVGWFPYFFLAYVSDYVWNGDSYPIPIWADYLFLFLKFSTGLVDPLLYTFFKTDFQSAIRSLSFNSYENINPRVTINMSSLQTPNNQQSSSS